MFLQKRIQEWVQNNVINQDVAHRLLAYEKKRNPIRSLFQTLTIYLIGSVSFSWILYRSVLVHLSGFDSNILWITDLIATLVLSLIMIRTTLFWLKKNQTLSKAPYALFTLGSIYMIYRGSINHLSFYSMAWSWITIVSFSILAGLGFFRLLAVTAVLGYLFFAYFFGNTASTELRILQNLFICSLPLFIFFEFLKDKNKDTFIAQSLWKGVQYLQALVEIIFRRIGFLRILFAAFFITLKILGIYAQQLDLTRNLSPEFFDLLPNIGLFFLLLTLTLIELPRFSGVFSFIACIQIAILTTSYQNGKLIFSLKNTHFESGKLGLILAGLALTAYALKSFTRSHKSLSEVTSLGPMGAVTLFMLLAMV